VWLYPASYVAHVAEEYWGGEGFPAWFERVAGVEFPEAHFLAWNCLAVALMLVGAGLVLSQARMRWIAITFATVVLTNALLHAAGSLLTLSYSPGLYSGLLIWVPLSAFTLRRAWRGTPRATFWRSIGIGAGIHLVVLAILLAGPGP
jgi:hypothetical protein